MEDLEATIAEEDRRYAAWIAEARPLLAENKHAEALRLPNYPRFELGPAPWTALTVPLSCVTVALVSSAGVYRDDQVPFDARNPAGDTTWRLLPAETPFSRLRIAHTHYDHASAEADINSVYPVDRLRELARSGVIGALHPTVYSFSGYMRDLWRWRREGAPAIAQALVAEGVRAALLVPV